MRSALASLFVGLWLAACGGDPTPEAASCGVAGQAAGGECARMADCGAGAQNEVKVQFCEHCFKRADTHVCEAGACRELARELVSVNFVFEVPERAAGAKSFTIASVNPIMADGTRVSCSALLAPACTIDDNGAINARNSRFNALPAGDIFMGAISVDPGEDRMLVLQLTDGMQGTGTVVARGCTEIDVPAAGTNERFLITLDGNAG